MPMWIRTVHILLIEDDPGDARLIREMLLKEAGSLFTLTTCERLREGLELIREKAFDVVLLDLTLPDSAGIDTLFTLNLEAPDVAIVVLTGFDDQTMLGVQAVQTGAQDYLVKGDVDPKLLRRSIRYAIERKRIDTALRRSEQEYRTLIEDVFDTSMVAVIILDKDLKVVWCNEATEIYFGISRGKLIGKDKRRLIDDELKCIFADPDDYAARLLHAYDGHTFSERFECHVLPDGARDERFLEHWSQPIRDGMYSGGRIEQYTDITDRKKLEFAESEQRQFAEALSEIATLLTSSLHLQDVLDRILASLDLVVPHDLASIIIMEGNQFQVAGYRTSEEFPAEEAITEGRLELDYRLYIDEMARTGKPIFIPDMQRSELGRNNPAAAAARAYVGAPIQVHDEIIGVINLFSQRIGFFNASHADRLSAFAELAAIAIQNARLYQQSQELAALEERQRLARELHDSVSQSLFTCRTMTETALRRWEKDPERAYDLVQDVHQLVVTALSEMRILLLELRPSALTQVGLKQLFEQYLQPIQDRRQFELKIQIDDISPLPPDVQIVLYRITQEALNNINKHAQAKHVEVRVNGNTDRTTLEIHDDGSGFDMTEVTGTSLGLNVMRERADEIGAELHIQSERGKGTHIIVVWKHDEREMA
jgi:PAS domain S-box-containing protein